MDKCELCKKPIEFVGIIWTPNYGKLKGFRLYFDTVVCVKNFKEQYYKAMEERVGYESQNTNIKEEME